MFFQLTLFRLLRGFPGGSGVKNLPASAGNTGSFCDLGRSHVPRSNQARVPIATELRSGASQTLPADPFVSHRYCTLLLQLLKPVSPRALALQREKPPQ